MMTMQTFENVYLRNLSSKKEPNNTKTTLTTKNKATLRINKTNIKGFNS